MARQIGLQVREEVMKDAWTVAIWPYFALSDLED